VEESGQRCRYQSRVDEAFYSSENINQAEDMTPVESIVERGHLAQQKYEQYSQEQVNLVVEAVA
jgi:hypothetical protein